MARKGGRGIMDELIKAARQTARSQPTKQERKRTEQDLRQMLSVHQAETEAAKSGKITSSPL